MRRVVLAMVLAATVVSAGAVEFKLPDGTRVSGARVDHIEGDLAVIEYDGGVTTVPVADLPAALRPRKLPPGSTRAATAAATPAPPRLGTPPPRAVAAAPRPVPTNALPAIPAAPNRGAARPDYVIDPLRGVVSVPLPPPPPASPSASRRALPEPDRVVVTAESVPYVDRFAEDEDNPAMKRYQEGLLEQKKKKDAKDAPKDFLDLPVFRYSPMRDPNKSAFSSPAVRTDDQFTVPNYMKPSSYIDDPYSAKKVQDASR